MTTHQEALEAALAAFWDENVTGIQAMGAAIRAYLTTLAPIGDEITQPLDDMNVSVDGFCKWSEVANARNEIRRRLQADRTAQAAEIEQQRRLIDGIDEERRSALELCVQRNKEITALEALLDKAVETLEPFAGLAESIAANHPGWDHDGFVMSTTPTGMMLPFSWFRRSRSTLTAIQEARHGA